VSWGDVIGGLLGGLVAGVSIFAGIVGLGAFAKRHFRERGRASS
jgi:hypothetical protein